MKFLRIEDVGRVHCFLTCDISFIHTINLDISIAPLQSPLLFRGALDYSIDTVSELTRQSATGN